MRTQTPTAQRLHHDLAALIAGLRSGERLPSEPELSRRLGVSRATLREAMRTFETQGLLHRRQGSGTYVARPSQVIESGLEVLESIETLARRIGLPVALGHTVIHNRPATADELRALALEAGVEVLEVGRVILTEGHPAAYLVDILPASLLSKADLEPDFSGSVLDVLLRQKKSTALHSSRCEISATTATPEIAHALGIQRGDVLLSFVAYLYDLEGRVVDYSFSYFLPGYFRFHVVRRVGALE